MCQLLGIVEGDPIPGLLLLLHRTADVVLLITTFPYLHILLELVPPIPEVTYRRHIEIVLSHAHRITPKLHRMQVNLLVRLLAVHLHPLLDDLLLLLDSQLVE